MPGVQPIQEPPVRLPKRDIWPSNPRVRGLAVSVRGFTLDLVVRASTASSSGGHTNSGKRSHVT